MAPLSWVILLFVHAAQTLARTEILNQPIPAHSCDYVKYRRAICLGEVAPCVPPAAEVSQPVTVSAAEVQAVTKDTLQIFACRVKVLSSICRCGMFSHCSNPTNGVTEDYITLDRDDCLHAHKDKRWVYGSHKFVGFPSTRPPGRQL